MADPKFRTEIVADPAPYKAGMDVAAQIAQQIAQSMAASMASSMQGIQASMQTGIGGITSMFARLNVVVAGASALLATGGFAAGIKNAINMADELGKLSQKVGITVEELQFLKYAAEISNLSMEGLTKGLKKLSTQMFDAATGSKESRALFVGLGVEFESMPGKLKPTDEVLLKLAEKFKAMEDGPVKAALAVKLFGREGLALIPFLNQGRDGIERLRGEFKSLAGTMTSEMAASAEKFNDSLKTLELASNRLGITMANRMLPALNDITAAMIEAAKESGILYTLLVGVGGVMVNLFKGDSEEKQLDALQLKIRALRTEMQSYEARGDRGLLRVLQRKMDELGAQEAALVRAIVAKGGRLPYEDEPPARRAPKVQPGLDAFNTTDKKAPSRMPEWEGALSAWRNAFEKMQDEQGSAEQLGLERERTYWRAVLDITNLSKEERIGAAKRLDAVEHEIRKQAFEARIADLKAQMDAAETTAEQRIALASRVAAIEIDRNKAGSKEAIEAVKAVQKEYDAWAKKQREIGKLIAAAEKDDQLSRVEIERNNLDTLEQLGIINAADKIARLKELKEIEYAINLAELEREKGLMTLGTVEYQEAQNKILDLKRKHNLEIKKLDDQVAIETKKSTDKWLDPIADGFQKMIDGMIAGTRKWTDLLRSVLASVAQQYAATAVKIAVDWVKTEFIKTQATVTGEALREAAALAGSGASITATAGSAIANIGASAWEAAASVYANVAKIPYVGWILAPAMAAAAAATVLGFIGSIAKASGGFDVPAGINPITQLHGNEMVLPAKLAERVRGMTDDGGGPQIQVNVNIRALDGESARRVFMHNKTNIANAMRSALRNGYGTSSSR